MDLEAILKAIPQIKAQGVSKFKFKDFEIEFEKENKPQDAAQIMEPLKQAEESLPPDLRTDRINNYDNILHWSGSPNEEAQGIHGVEDLPLTMGSPP